MTTITLVVYNQAGNEVFTQRYTAGTLLFNEAVKITENDALKGHYIAVAGNKASERVFVPAGFSFRVINEG